MQRIEAGTLKGRRLLALPRGVDGLRPMAARVRGAVFDRLGAHLEGARVLDLFAGSGAMGFEALSRGASLVTFVEADPRVIRHLRDQAAALGVEDRVDVRRGMLPAALVAGPKAAAYDLVLVDPPFARPDVIEPVARELVAHAWLADGAIVVCERERVRGKSAAVTWPVGLELEQSRIYGQAQIDFLVAVGSAPTPEDSP
jgi:16S rRNA (guanine966-N2)-methyltransferase